VSGTERSSSLHGCDSEARVISSLRQHAPPDPRKPARLRAKRARWVTVCDADGPSWMGRDPPCRISARYRRAGGTLTCYMRSVPDLGLTLSGPPPS